MLITMAIWAVAVLILLIVGGDGLRRQFAGDVPALTRRHLIWVIIAQAAVIASMFLLPVIVLIRDAF